MTAETLAAALLKDVPRINGDRHFLVSDVLAALSRAMSDDLAERAGAVVERLKKASHERDEFECVMSASPAADLITALLSQNAALRGERDVALAANRGLVRLNEITEARAERLEAALRLLHENVVLAFPALADLGPVANARAALKGTDHE